MAEVAKTFRARMAVQNETLASSATGRHDKVALCRDDVDASSLLVEHDMPVDDSEQGVIVALSHAASRTPFGAALTDQNVARGDDFAAEFFDAAALCVGIAAVAAGSLTFLMCHFFTRMVGFLEVQENIGTPSRLQAVSRGRNKGILLECRRWPPGEGWAVAEVATTFGLPSIGRTKLLARDDSDGRLVTSGCVRRL